MSAGDYLVFIDESGDHGLTNVQEAFPLFVLALVVVEADAYKSGVLPEINALKIKHFGHEGVILHEREIRKSEGPFRALNVPGARSAFLEDLSATIERLPFCAIACVIDKREFAARRPHSTSSPYDVALEYGLERVAMETDRYGVAANCRVLIECRGKKEDAELELVFRRICDGSNFRKRSLPYTPEFIPKSANVAGLQIADLIAKPIGLRVLHPHQKNRAADVAWLKLRRHPQSGDPKGYGLKIFPDPRKVEGPRG